jgi:hypothetical protein
VWRLKLSVFWLNIIKICTMIMHIFVFRVTVFLKFLGRVFPIVIKVFD